MITNALDHLISYDDLLVNAIETRRGLNVEDTCKYGIEILDQYLGGILPSELVVIGADTGVGKSEIAYSIAIENARRGKKVLLMSLEGDINEIAYRHLQKEINKKSFVKTISYRFNLDENIYTKEDEAYEEIEKNVKENLLIYNKQEIPSLEFISNLIDVMKDHVDMIIIDHLHYIHNSGDNETMLIGEIMRKLKHLTDNIKKPIILMSHLKYRALDKDPTENDLYGSSNIKKEATTLILLSRMAKHNREGMMDDEILNNKRYCGTKILIKKSRIGLPLSNFALIYDRYKKDYLHKYSQLLEQESGAKLEDALDFNKALGAK